MAVLAVVAIFLFGTLPPRPVAFSTDGADAAVLQRTVRGAYHIHTTRSDGALSKAEIAAAASRAGLQFAIFTDHGDGTRPPDPPEYLDGVLCLDGVEISTDGGHYAALGMRQAPYPLGGAPAAVVEDVARLGGFGTVAHPDHPKAELAWSAWDLPIDGFEWINADAEWRNESIPRLAQVLFHYLFRPAPALASVFDRPQQTLARWAPLLERRPVVALAAADAHGGVGGSAIEEGGARFAAGPSYEASFRTLSNHVLLAEPFSGDAAADAGALLDAIRRGRVYTVIDAVARGVALQVDEEARMLRFAPHPPPHVSVDAKGAWMEAHHPNAPGDPPVPWVLANPLFADRPPALPVRTLADALADIHLASEWRVEKDPGSAGDVRQDGDRIGLEYRLRADERASQFVALVADLAKTQSFDAIAFRGWASRPMRVSVQLRFPPDDQRWVASVYLDETEREIVVDTGDLGPAERQEGGLPDPALAGSILFVVDLTNARPGDAGTLTISGLTVSARSPAEPR